VLINNRYGTFVILEDKIFHIESGCIYDTGPISEEELKEIIWRKTSVSFTKNGKPHRDNDLPAVAYTDGTKLWYKNGKFHRDNDLPAIVRANGTKLWYKNGTYTRIEHANQ